MTVYIDILIFTNTVIDYLILSASDRILKLRAKTWRIALASFIGSLFTLLIFVDIRSPLFSIGIKLISTAAISFTAFFDRSYKDQLKRAAVTLFVSFVFSGMMICIYQLFKPPNMLIVNDIVYFEYDPLVMLAVTAVIYGAVTLAEKIMRERLRAGVVELSFSVGGRRYSCMAKIDTGCSLTEPFSSSPVIVADKRLFSAESFEKKRIVPYTAVGGSSVLYAVKPDDIYIDRKPSSSDVYIASGAVENPSYSAVINPDAIR